MISRILVTGFEPWAEHRVNSSWVAVEPLEGRTVGGSEVKVVSLPVDVEGAPRLLREGAEAFRPDAVVSFGMITNPLRRERDRWRVELIARNRFRLDREGEAVQIVAGGPRILPTGLPSARIYGGLLESDLPAEFSEDAGASVCNYVFYAAMVDAARGLLPALTGLVHVPPPSGPGDVPPNAERLREGARAVIGALARLGRGAE